ncbi:MAG: Sec-independent protein translocase protein TatA [Candidatus Gottesmanbacteria bacterium GW2011_GWB1_43_11]|uniref:Sec-independent protein translocase protein TatA n=1 Tax=Candidatus Gottesmanbacteria bacterium GW2011_GWB1_43_11 TaxID=1618446 RepID=A0A0G1CFD8_9BACT|nr:MAG: Sec-independent protein translocase protein TatA [Candidatus Gottesmanbacteria bacterium GW2011_GWB1_43_11]
MFGFGTTEILIVAGLLILFFGAKKVSDLAQNVGEAIKHIRGGFSDEDKKGK